MNARPCEANAVCQGSGELTDETMAADGRLQLPLIGPGEMSEPSARSIDEVDAWIEEDYALFFDRESYDREKQAQSVDVMFVL
jgi:hypothetical protein